ncbi:MAG: SdrD B-like domain-containing protein [Anaerolineae bacterium]
MKRLHLIELFVLVMGFILFLPGAAATAGGGHWAARPLLQAQPGGSICINAFADENANGIHDTNEGYMAGVTITVAGSQQIVGQAVSPGNPTPVCFENLAPGNYQVAQTVPGRLEMTTAANAMLTVEQGKTYGVEFGSRVRPPQSNPAPETPISSAPIPASSDAATSASPAQGNSGGFGILAYSGLFILFLAVLLFGVLIFIALRQQAN